MDKQPLVLAIVLVAVAEYMTEVTQGENYLLWLMVSRMTAPHGKVGDLVQLSV